MVAPLAGVVVDGTDRGVSAHEAVPSCFGAAASGVPYAGHVEDPHGSGVRLAEVLASLSLGIDLGFGQPMEHVLRQCRIAMRLCDLLGGDDDTRTAAYHRALLVNVAHPNYESGTYRSGDRMRLATSGSPASGATAATTVTATLAAVGRFVS